MFQANLRARQAVLYLGLNGRKTNTVQYWDVKVVIGGSYL